MLRPEEAVAKDIGRSGSGKTHVSPQRETPSTSSGQVMGHPAGASLIEQDAREHVVINISTGNYQAHALSL